MKKEVESVVLLGHQIQRYLYFPDGEIRGASVLFHGQGDCIERYEEVLSVFLERGLIVIGADLPGHGQSEGRRGHVPGFTFIDALVESHLDRIDSLGSPGPLGILGHSCGGLLALYSLLQKPERWDFAWLSSPLLKPAASLPPWKASLLLSVSRLLPWLSFHTGVDFEDCLNPAPSGKSLSDESPNEEDSRSLFHSRITLSWAREISEHAEHTWQQFCKSRPSIPLLMTQGSDDAICPPKYAKSLLETAYGSLDSYREFPGLRHEPFADPQNEPVFEALRNFLNEALD